jgi:hypothetical protein
MKTYHIYAEIGPEARIYRVSIDDDLETAIATAKYLRQSLPCVEVISTDLDHVPDHEAARIIGKQEWYEYDDMPSPAALLGRKGGQAKSEAKAKAARENAKKGGRPTSKIHQIRKELRRLDADGQDGIEAKYERNDEVLLYDNQVQFRAKQDDALKVLQGLEDGAGFDDTWEALGSSDIEIFGRD